MSGKQRRYCHTIAIVSVFLSFNSGCHLMHQHDVPGVVYTGGQYAVSRSLPLPRSGMTLATAVDLSLRPWLRTDDGPTQIQYVRASPPPFKQKGNSNASDLTPPPTIDTSKLFQELFQIMAIEDVLDRKDQIKTAVTDIQLENGLSAKQQSEIRRDIIDLINDNRELFTEESEQSEKKRSDLAITIGNLAEPSINASVEEAEQSDQDATTQPSIKTDGAKNTKSVDDSAKRQTRTEGRVSRLPHHNLAVVLTRKSGRRIIAPFWLVMRHAAGDITLNDGDRLDLVHFGLTEIGARNSSKMSATIFVEGIGKGVLTQTVYSNELADLSNVASGIKSGYGSLVDTLVVEHIGASGNVEEYLIPRHSYLYGDDSVGEGWVDIAELRSGDIVRFQNLQLVNAIQSGQNQVIKATAEEILTGRKPKRGLRSIENGKRRLATAIMQRWRG